MPAFTPRGVRIVVMSSTGAAAATGAASDEAVAEAAAAVDDVVDVDVVVADVVVVEVDAEGTSIAALLASNSGRPGIKLWSSAAYPRAVDAK